MNDEILKLIGELRDSLGTSSDDNIIYLAKKLVEEAFPVDESLGASLERLTLWSSGDVNSPYEKIGHEFLDGDIERVLDAAKRWNERGSKPFPWECICGCEYTPDQQYFKCQGCEREWGNPWYKEEELPQKEDVGEGWEVCDVCKGEGSFHGGLMYEGCHDCKGRGKRRVVKTKKPDKIFHEQDVWILNEHGWLKDYTAGYVNKRWKQMGCQAWAVQLDGETRVPDFCIEWEQFNKAKDQ